MSKSKNGISSQFVLYCKPTYCKNPDTKHSTSGCSRKYLSFSILVLTWKVKIEISFVYSCIFSIIINHVSLSRSPAGVWHYWKIDCCVFCILLYLSITRVSLYKIYNNSLFQGASPSKMSWKFCTITLIWQVCGKLMHPWFLFLLNRMFHLKSKFTYWSRRRQWCVINIASFKSIFIS